MATINRHPSHPLCQIALRMAYIAYTFSDLFTTTISNSRASLSCIHCSIGSLVLHSLAPLRKALVNSQIYARGNHQVASKSNQLWAATSSLKNWQFICLQQHLDSIESIDLPSKGIVDIASLLVSWLLIWMTIALLRVQAMKCRMALAMVANRNYFNCSKNTFDWLSKETRRLAMFVQTIHTHSTTLWDSIWVHLLI